MPAELVDDRPDGREIGVAGVGRRRADGDVEEVGALNGLGDVEGERQPLGVPLQELVEPGLEDRHLAGAEPLDPGLDDVAHDDVVPQLGEAGAGDEADVAGAEDCDSAHGRVILSSGFRPLAIASIVSLESVSSSELTTQ